MNFLKMGRCHKLSDFIFWSLINISEPGYRIYLQNSFPSEHWKHFSSRGTGRTEAKAGVFLGDLLES